MREALNRQRAERERRLALALEKLFSEPMDFELLCWIVQSNVEVMTEEQREELKNIIDGNNN